MSSSKPREKRSKSIASHRGKRHWPPVKTFGFAVLALALIGVGLLYFLLQLPLLISWLMTTNVIAFLLYTFDKWQAQGDRLRVPEIVLHGLVLVGGCVGAMLAMTIYHHKTRKASFQRVYWSIVGLQLIALSAYIAWIVLR